MRNDIHLEEGCPWYPLSEMRLPNVKWCEANLCSWIVNPADTWSNLTFLIFGVYLLKWFKPKEIKNKKEKFLFGSSLIIMGTGSFIHHAAYNFVCQIIDFFVMYWFEMLVFFANLVRLGKVKSEKMIPLWIWSVLGMTAFTVICDFLDIKIQAIVMIIALVLFAQELMIHYSKVPAVQAYRAANLKLIGWAAFSMIIAATFSAVDIKGIWCDPDNHWFQGHAFWHLFSSIGVFILSIHFLKIKPFLK